MGSNKKFCAVCGKECDRTYHATSGMNDKYFCCSECLREFLRKNPTWNRGA